MPRLFISHSGKDILSAIAFKQWLGANGWPEDDVFLDVENIGAGEYWKEALRNANARCEAVILLASPEALSSPECLAEVRKAEDFGKEIVVVLLRDLEFSDHRLDSYKDRQIVDLAAPPQTHIETVAYGDGEHQIRFNDRALARIKDYLVKRGITPDHFAWPPRDRPDADPFPGLSAFTEDDAGIFFGRDADIMRGLDKLRLLRRNGRPRLLVIQASSGAGKSSFLRAGLWPRLERDPDFAPVAVLRPAQGILQGPEGLGRKLAPLLSLPNAPINPGDIHAQMMASDAAKAAADFAALMSNAVTQAFDQRRIGDKDARAPALVLAIDQAEELFASEHAAESERFLSLLANLLREPQQGVEPFAIFTVRSDGAPRLLQALADLKVEMPETLPLLPLPQDCYREIILKPLEVIARRGQRLKLDPALTSQLVTDATGADALPLLAFTLSHLYHEFGAGGEITLDQYQRMGGIAGSIDAALKRALANPGNAPAIPQALDEQLACLRAAFIPWLARIDPETKLPLRRVTALDKFPQASRAVVMRLVETRLLAADRRSGADVVEVAHEALLREWALLKRWLAEDLAALTMLEAVKRAASDWVDHQRDGDWLDHSGTRLEAAEKVAAREDLARDLTADARDYLHECRRRDDAEHQERLARLEHERQEQERRVRDAEMLAAADRLTTQRTRIGLGVALALTFAAIVLGVFTWIEARHAQTSQSRFLAELAGGQIRAGDAVTAMLLSIEALPDGGLFERPLVPEAALRLASAADAVREQRVLAGHKDSVVFAAFSADGGRAVTASADRTARIWDLAHGKMLAELTGHTQPVNRATFSPDGSRVLTASNDGSARIWDSTTGHQIAILSGHGGPVLSALFDRDGTHIVTASTDKTARIWDGATGRPIAVLQHSAGVNTAEFSADGKRIVTACDDGKAYIWDAETGQQTGLILSGHAARVTSAAFSLDGSRVVTTSDDHTGRLWNAATGALIAELPHTANVTSGRFSLDGAMIVTASEDSRAKVWDGHTGKLLFSFGPHDSYVTSAGFSPDGSRVVTTSSDQVRLWSTATGSEIDRLGGHSARVDYATFSPDGRQILTASDDGTARLWDGQISANTTVLTGHSNSVWTAVFSPDAAGAYVLTASDDKTARLWDSVTGKELHTFAFGDAVNGAAFSPDGKRLVVALDSNSAVIMDATTYATLLTLKGQHSGHVNTASFSPDERFVVTASDDGTAVLWDAATGAGIRPFLGHHGSVNSAVFSGDGKRIVTSSDDKTAQIWDVATGSKIVALVGHGALVRSAVFDASGERVLTASWDNTARIWDSRTGKLIAVLAGHLKYVNSARFSPDGKRVVTASADESARIWDSATGEPIVSLDGQKGALFDAEFSPDGRRVATAALDQTVRLWRLEPVPVSTQALVNSGISRVPRCLSPDQRTQFFLAASPPAWCNGKWPY